MFLLQSRVIFRRCQRLQVRRLRLRQLLSKRKCFQLHCMLPRQRCSCRRNAGLYKAASSDCQSFVCTSCKPGFQCAAGTSSAVRTVTLLINVAVSDFTPALRQDFLDSIAHTSGVEPQRVRIVSGTERSSRRLLSIMRRLLNGSTEVEFAITYLNVNNASSVALPTLEQFAADADDRELPLVQLLIESELVVYDQRIPCEQGNVCAGGDQVLSCRIFSCVFVIVY